MTNEHAGNGPPPPPQLPLGLAQFPYPVPSFHLPCSNPSSNFYPSTNNHPNSSTATVTVSSSITTALSSLGDLIQLSEATIQSISALIPSTGTITSSPAFSPCPFNPNHRLPPEALFRHTFSCPSAPFNPDPYIIDSLHYSETLQSSQDLLENNRFVQTLNDPNNELCFSLEDYFVNFNSNFFYRDCPGVVSSVDLVNNTKPMLLLPHVLAVECENFVPTGDDTEVKAFSRDSIRFLPSEIQLVRTETEGWNDYPISYSHRVLRAMLCLNMNNWSGCSRLILLNSPRYGVVIDVPMREHIALLFRLSLKAIVSEALRSENSLTNKDVRDLVLNKSFNCPVLVETMMWLVSQLSVLYGESNGKPFAIDMLKLWLQRSSTDASLFPLAKQASTFNDADKKSEEQNGRSQEHVVDNVGSKAIDKTFIFVSQVAAAVAALHERSLLQMKMRASLPLTTYQKFMEHDNISKRADEERQKRSNYNAIIEHDRLLLQHSSNEDGKRKKTREELLAEERDYKRRRISYRGKKVKRSYIQVMRDIIDGYMQEIKQANEIHYQINEAEKIKRLSGESSSICKSSSDNNEPTKASAESPDASKRHSHCHDRQLCTPYDPRKRKFPNNDLEDDRSYLRDSNMGQKGLESLRRSDRQRDNRYFLKSLDENVRSFHRYEEINHGRQDDAETSRKYFSNSLDQRSHTQSSERSNLQRKKVCQNFEIKDKRTRNSYRNHIVESGKLGGLDDRYDPGRPRDMYEDDDYS